MYSIKVEVVIYSCLKGIRWLKKEIFFCLNRWFFSIVIIVVSVVIFKLFVVLEGEVFMYIKNVMNNKVGRVKLLIGMVLKFIVVIVVID